MSTPRVENVYAGRPYFFAFALACVALFAVVGVAIWALVAWMFWKSHQAAEWVEVPARIDRVGWSMTRAGRNPRTSRVEAEYTYEFEGQTFTGDRVGIVDIADNIGWFHRRVYRELQTHLEEQRPFRCFVNPNRPSEAVLYRELRRGIVTILCVFAVVFTVAGFWKSREIWRQRPWRW